MKYVDFGHDGLQVSRFGLGCMRFKRMKTADGKSVIDEDKAIELIRYAIDHGVNYIDTAYVYDGSEVVVGKALRDGYRERVILATKQPTSILKNDAGEQQRAFEEQLKRLQTDRFDVYFLHNLGVKNWNTVERLGGLDFVSQKREEGLVKYIAASVHSDYPHFQTVADAFDWDLMMLQYNYYDKFNQAGQAGARYVRNKGIPFVTMESNHGGMLAANVPPSVRATFSGPDMPDYERSLRWLISQPEPTVILNGCTTIEQLKQNLEVFDKYDIGCLNAAQEAEYNAAREEWNKLVKVPCTDCRYCMPCPHGVNIPAVFDAYNMLARAAKTENAQTWMYKQLLIDTGSDASKCKECRACEPKCPQAIRIIASLKDAHQALNQ